MRPPSIAPGRRLLLVRTELQATARLCEGLEIPPPEALAPSLRTWMDQIQRMAGEVEQI